MIEAARRLSATLEATPYAARLGFLGGEVTSDAVTASVPYAAVLANAQGFVHGGVSASLSVWSAMVLAVASDREQNASARPISVSVSYVAAAREEALHATARVTSRGRDIAHVAVEVVSDRGRPVASALAVLRTVPDPPRQAPRREASPPDAGPSERLISPFSRAMGMEVRSQDAASVALTMPRDINEGLGGAVDPGALISLADTCAALACLPSLDERLRGSATLSLSAVFGAALSAPALAVGRMVAEDREIRSALVEVGRDGGAAGRHPAMTACVAYRFVSAQAQS